MNMKTREGIYFGNREIVERYIGGKLVWRKKRWITILKCATPEKFQEQLGLAVKVWCHITKEIAKKYPPLDSQKGLQVRFYTADSSHIKTILNVGMSHSYGHFYPLASWDSKIWTECMMEFSFSTYEDMITFKNILTTNAKAHTIEVGKIV